MDGTEVSVFEQTNQIRLRRLLQRQHRVALETQVSLEILSNLTDQPLEWELPDQKFGTLLVLADFSASYIQYTPQLTPTKLEIHCHDACEETHKKIDNLPKSNSSGAVSVGLLHPSRSRG
jgi:hypothetical protein